MTIDLHIDECPRCGEYHEYKIRIEYAGNDQTAEYEVEREDLFQCEMDDEIFVYSYTLNVPAGIHIIRVETEVVILAE